MNLLIAGNTMTPKCIGIFNIPPLETCTPSRWCKKHCYALHGRHTWPNVVTGQQWRYRQSLEVDFPWRMIGEISCRKSFRFIRIHLAGDFYSRGYVDKWAAVAIQCSNKLFRVNTKRRDLLRYMRKVFPENVIVRESTDPSRKRGSGIFPVAAVEGTPGSNKFFRCVDDCEACNYYCYTHPKVNLVFKKLR